MNISSELKAFVAANPHIKQVYFTSDGHYYLHAFQNEAGNLVAPAKAEMQASDPIVAMVSREEILATPEAQTEHWPEDTNTATITAPEVITAPAEATPEAQTAHNG